MSQLEPLPIARLRSLTADALREPPIAPGVVYIDMPGGDLVHCVARVDGDGDLIITPLIGYPGPA